MAIYNLFSQCEPKNGYIFQRYAFFLSGCARIYVVVELSCNSDDDFEQEATFHQRMSTVCDAHQRLQPATFGDAVSAVGEVYTRGAACFVNTKYEM